MLWSKYVVRCEDWVALSSRIDDFATWHLVRILKNSPPQAQSQQTAEALEWERPILDLSDDKLKGGCKKWSSYLLRLACTYMYLHRFSGGWFGT